MLKTKFISNALALVSIFSLLFVSLTPVKAQQTMAELTVTGTAERGELPFVTVNGERAVTGRSLGSPSQISVPASARASISFGKAGQIELSPGANVNLNFTGTDISISLNEGRVRVVSLPNTSVKIQTKDAMVINDKAQSDVFAVEIVGDVTGVSTEAGVATLNGTPVEAGQFLTAKPSTGGTPQTGNNTSTGGGNSNNSSLLLLILGAAGAAGLIAALAAGGGGSSDNPPPISPTR